MTALFHAHSGLRYLVLLAGLVALLYFLYGWLAKKSFEAPGPAILALLVGVFDIQVLLGAALYMARRTTEGVNEHLAFMIAGVVVLHVAARIQRKRPEPVGYGLPFLGVAVVAILVILGISAIGRPLV